MDLTRVKNLRLLLTAHFAVISWLAALLVASGAGESSLLLPVLIFFCTLVAFVFVDLTERFELKSFVAAIAMTLATGAAIGQYAYCLFVNESEPGRLMAVAGLLVYPEAVLFLQRKNLRIFEQLAIFLLLEMIVAALVNTNILFGLLLAPIMLLWVSALFLFSRYSTLVKIDPSIEVQHPRLAEILFKRMVKSVLGENKKQPLVTSTFNASTDVQSSRTMRRSLQSIPIGVGALVFASLFFYLVPRLGNNNYGGAMGVQSAIGLPERMTFGNVAKMLENPAPVMRVTFQNESGSPVQLQTPPYLRASLFDYYGRSSNSMQGSSRVSKGEWYSTYSLTPTKLGGKRYAPGRSNAARESEQKELQRLRSHGRDALEVQFELRPEFKEVMFTVPPIFAPRQKQELDLSYDRQLMLLQPDSLNQEQGKAVSYKVLSAGFQKGGQTAVTPTLEPSDGTIIRLLANFRDFRQADIFRQEILDKSNIDQNSKIRIAREFERYLAFSGEFSYTLDLRAPTDSDLDPVEDFMINQRAGHCQYFATAMVCLLRQSGIPSRLVIGYRPSEFNTLGNYFTVRQKDAHAWVEAYFTREQLANSIYRDQLTDDEHYWVRFDPTPPPDGELSIREQDGQAIDFAEKLWQEYVVEGQNLAADSGIYDPVSDSDSQYGEMARQIRDFIQNLRSGNLFSKFGFAWPIAILTMIVGCIALLIWQAFVFLPKIAPRWALRLGIVKNEMDLEHPFYSKCLKVLTRLGIQRSQSSTPAEFTDSAKEVLEEKGQSVEGSVDFLTSLYYRLRFGKQETMTSTEQSEVGSQLSRVEKAVEQARKS